jgi:hypothetical protein
VIQASRFTNVGGKMPNVGRGPSNLPPGLEGAGRYQSFCGQ